MSDKLYPDASAPKFSLTVNAGLVSISHWGAFDISPFGAILHPDGTLDWQENGETFFSTQVDFDAFQTFMRHVPI